MSPDTSPDTSRYLQFSRHHTKAAAPVIQRTKCSPNAIPWRRGARRVYPRQFWEWQQPPVTWDYIYSGFAALQKLENPSGTRITGVTA